MCFMWWFVFVMRVMCCCVVDFVVDFVVDWLGVCVIVYNLLMSKIVSLLFFNEVV